MKFIKDPDGLIFFAICHLIILGQVLFIGYIDDEYTTYNEYNEKVIYQSRYLIANKIIFYLIVLLAFISHVKTAITDPGIITNKNNLNVIQFYYYVHEPLIKRAISITEKQTEEGIRKIIFEANNIKFDKNENYSLDNDEDFANDSDVDEQKFEKKTSINENIKKGIIRNYRLKLTRCRSCYVARPTNVHHCATCHGCILERDHHCPWVNNCIGLFNKKYFILYNFYSLLSVLYSIILFFYYVLYKHFNVIFNNSTYIWFSILFIIISIIYGLFAIILLWEQYNNIKHDCTLIDYNNGILMEKATFMQRLIIIFLDNISFKWFLPFISGGYYDLYCKMCKIANKNTKKQSPKKYKKKKVKLE